LVIAVFAPSAARAEPPSETDAQVVVVGANVRGAQAGFSAVDPSDATGCTRIGAGLAAVQYQLLQYPGQPFANATMSVFKFNACTNQYLLFATANPVFFPHGAFKVNGLTSATLTATVDLFDHVSQAPVSVDLDITWSADPTDATQQDPANVKYPDGFNHSGGRQVDAEAHGTVRVGGENFTPEPGSEGRIYFANGISINFAG
jgi:hypothetical protein